MTAQSSVMACFDSMGPWFPVSWLIISYDIWRLFDVNEDEINTNPELADLYGWNT